MKTIQEVEDEIVAEFGLTDSFGVYEKLIKSGELLPKMISEYKVDSSLVKGCQSKVWMFTFDNYGRKYFIADSNSVIVRGILALLLRVLEGRPVDEIRCAKLEFIDRIGLRGHLSSTRSNGLTAIIEKMKA